MAMRKNSSEQLTEEDGPFSYSYIAVMGVPGIRLNEINGDIDLFSFPELNATALLTEDWDRYCSHIDRSTAIANLLLTGFQGRSRFNRPSRWTSSILRNAFGVAYVFERNLVREERKVRLARVKAHTSPGCYLVYRAAGELVEPLQIQFTRKVKRIGFGFDLVSGDQYRSIHRSALHGVAAALSLQIGKGTGSPEINNIADIVVFTGNQGLTIYPKYAEIEAVCVTGSKAPSSDELGELRKYIPLIAADRKIETAISLFVQSHRKDRDNLRAFIPAWSALELLVNRLARNVRAEWEELLRVAALPAWNKDLTGVDPEEYKMRDRFYSVACTLNLGNAGEDCDKFNLVNDHRNGYYHRNDVKERDLPTDEVRSLFRKYLALALSRQA